MYNLEYSVRQALQTGERDVDIITSEVLEDILAQDDPRESLYSPGPGSGIHHTTAATLPAVVSVIGRRRTKIQPGAQRDVVTTAALTRMKLQRLVTKLLVEKFYAPGFGYVTWGRATAQQHRAAIEHNNVSILGYQEDNERHERSLREIEAAGVTCMIEVPDE